MSFNFLQTALGKAVLQIQMTKLGLMPPEGNLPHTLKKTFQLLWANNGDIISKQYAGTNALKVNIKTCNFFFSYIVLYFSYLLYLTFHIYSLVMFVIFERFSFTMCCKIINSKICRHIIIKIKAHCIVLYCLILYLTN